MATNSSNPYMRQLRIFDPSQYDQYSIAIIGCGAIGSFVGIALAKLGLKRFTLIDHDKVEVHNIANQFFTESDLGQHKVVALRSNMINLSFGDDGSLIEVVPRKFGPKRTINNNIVFSCVDSMKVRKQIFERAIEDNVKVLIDTRMGGQVFEVYTVDLTDIRSVKSYKKSLHSDEDSEQTPCTERSIIYNVLAVSSLAVNQLVKVFNNVTFKKEITGDLVSVMIK